MKPATFEISGICNAKCKWCQTGLANRNGIKIDKTNAFVDFEDFKKAIEHMLEIGLIKTGGRISLFNWGEPLLHPQFKEIIQFLKEKNLNASLSTNASKPVLFDKSDDLSHVKTIIISMCGFSQESYDRIHGFDFEKIKRNIEKLVHNYRKCGFDGDWITISYHLYQFNLHEVEAAWKFAKKLKIGFTPGTAFINDFENGKKYIEGTLDKKILQEAGEELFLSNIQKNLSEVPLNYDRCSQFDRIIVDHHCNVITCCGDSSVYKSILEVRAFDEINAWRKNSDVCKTCIQRGQAYLGEKGSASYRELVGETAYMAIRFKPINIMLRTISNLSKIRNRVIKR